MSKKIIAYCDDGRNIVFNTIAIAGYFFNLSRAAIMYRMEMGYEIHHSGKVYYLDELVDERSLKNKEK